MVNSVQSANATALEIELNWFERVLENRLKHYFDDQGNTGEPEIVSPPQLHQLESHYVKLVNHYEAGPDERILLLLALVPHIRPQILDVFFTRNKTYGREFTEFGGVTKPIGGSEPFTPTVETALFILAGSSLERRFQVQSLFDAHHFLFDHGILQLDPPEENPSFGRSVLRVNRDYLELLTTGQNYEPDFGPHFPAKRIVTAMDWEDLVLNPFSMQQVREIEAWLEHHTTLLVDWGMARKVKPGYRVLFHGPAGTGKTTTAALLGKKTGLPVYRIDLSLVVSKYIGETEKNLEKVFRQAQNKDWILFFDEADALFGKRTEVADAHDRYANQEVSYLLQRIEDFAGLVILATNLKQNLDDAFMRRFQSLISFPLPRPAERKRLWSQSFSPKAPLDKALDLDALAADHELTGAAIQNAAAHASLCALVRGDRQITRRDIQESVRRELLKEGKSLHHPSKIGGNAR